MKCSVEQKLDTQQSRTAVIISNHKTPLVYSTYLQREFVVLAGMISKYEYLHVCNFITRNSQLPYKYFSTLSVYLLTSLSHGTCAERSGEKYSQYLTGERSQYTG